MYADLDNLRQLPLAEKLHVVEVLWEDIAASTEDFPLPAWLRNEVEQRLAEHDKSPAATLTRAELWQRVDEKRRQRKPVLLLNQLPGLTVLSIACAYED